MPTLSAKTIEAVSIWKTPDGSREIFEVALEHDGKTFKAKTYSKDISKVGWEGDIESYEKQGRNGSETFVKQPAKEFTPGSPGASPGKFGGGSKPSFDQFTMYLSYAKDLAVAMLDKGELDEVKYAKVLDAVATGGQTLYDGRPDAPKQEKPAEKPKDVVEEAVDEAQLNLDNIDEIFDE